MEDVGGILLGRYDPSSMKGSRRSYYAQIIMFGSLRKEEFWQTARMTRDLQLSSHMSELRELELAMEHMKESAIYVSGSQNLDSPSFQELVWDFHFLVADEFCYLLAQKVVRRVGVYTTVEMIM